MLGFVKQFKVTEFNPLYSNEHCGLHTQLKFGGDVTQAKTVGDGTESEVVVRSVRWRAEKESEYVSDVDDNSEGIREVLVDPVSKVFPHYNRKQYVKKSNKTCLKEYDHKCWKSRKAYHKAKCIHNRKKNSASYRNLIEKSKIYKQEMKRVKNKEKNHVVRQLRDNKSKDPKAYWNILKGNRKNKEIPIELEKLYEHFEALAHEYEDDSVAQSNIEYEINMDDSSTLNCPITEDEIRKCIRKLKNNKAAGSDGILNEYPFVCNVF